MNTSFVDKALVALIFGILLALVAQRWLQMPTENVTTLKEAFLAVVTFLLGKKVPQDA